MHHPRYLAYCLDTDEADYNCEAKRAVSPYDLVGTVEHRWALLSGEYAEEGEGEVPEINDPAELLGETCGTRLARLVPHDSMPRLTMPRHNTPCRATPHRATPHHTTPQHNTPRRAAPRR